MGDGHSRAHGGRALQEFDRFRSLARFEMSHSQIVVSVTEIWFEPDGFHERFDSFVIPPHLRIGKSEFIQ